MTKIIKTFNKLLEALNKLKKAQINHKKGSISTDELFDIEFHAHETEQKFIKILEK